MAPDGISPPWSLDPSDHTIKNASERMAQMLNDPVYPVLSAVPDLATILEKAMTL